MTNKEKYILAFTQTFNIDDSKIQDLEYQSIREWDSIGHLSLIVNLEEAFGISMDMDDITELSSFKKGIEILTKYDLEF